MAVSLLKTQADKYDSSVNKMARKYATTIQTPHGPGKCLQVSIERGEGKKPLLARFGGIPLKRQKRPVLRDREPVPAIARHREVVRRLLAGRCEICGQQEEVQVHQIRRSERSPTSRSSDSRSRPNGCASWQRGAARR
jgi:hypothetical protein